MTRTLEFTIPAPNPEAMALLFGDPLVAVSLRQSQQLMALREMTTPHQRLGSEAL